MLSLNDLHVPHGSLITSTKEVMFISALDVLFVRSMTEKLLDVFTQNLVELFRGGNPFFNVVRNNKRE